MKDGARKRMADSPSIQDGETANGEGSPLLLAQEDTESSKTTNFWAIMNIIKGNVGTGILALPKAFVNAGLLVGSAGIVFFGLLSVHCMHMLLAAAYTVRSKTGVVGLDYCDVVEQSFLLGPAQLRRFHRAARITINVFLVITQFGFCCVYMLFTPKTIKQVVESQVHTFSMPVQVYEIILVAFLIPLVFIKSLRQLAPFATLANFLSMSGLVIIFYYIVQDLRPVGSLPLAASLSTLPLYFGTALYTFEGIGLVLPIEKQMQKPKDFPGLTGVLNTGMWLVAIAYLATGFYGYLRFGPDCEDSITLNLPQDNWLYLTVKLMFAVSIFFSYAVQFYVPMEILLPIWQQRVKGTKIERAGEPILRIACVLLTFAIAASVDSYLDSLISLIGAAASSALALVFPPLLEIVVCWPERRTTPLFALRCVKNVFIMLIGIIGAVTGTFFAVKQLVDRFSSR